MGRSQLEVLAILISRQHLLHTPQPLPCLRSCRLPSVFIRLPCLPFVARGITIRSLREPRHGPYLSAFSANSSCSFNKALAFIGTYYSNAKTRFQSFFMLITFHPFDLAAS
jgi:hypothetical protein